MVRMIRLRKESPEIGWGNWSILPAGSPGVLAMCYEWRGNSVVVIHNFDSQPRQAVIHVDADGGDLLANLLVNEEVHAKRDGFHRVPLEAYGYRWYRVGGLSYALRSARDSGAGIKW